MELRAVGISRDFPRKRETANVFTAVDETSLVLPSGKLTALTGHSGSGKSTLLNMLAGLLAPTTGQVFLDGTDLYALDDEALSKLRNEHIGLIPQGQTALQSLTVLENVLLPYTLYHSGNAADRDVMQQRAEELLARTGIGDLKHVMPSELSGGELRRMAVARAMLKKPDAILADEPTADLDPENSIIVLEMLKAATEEGSAVLLVTHDKDALPYADSILEMSLGKLKVNNRTEKPESGQ